MEKICLFMLETCYMKKILSNNVDCTKDNSILLQVSSGFAVIFFCSECYNLKYSEEVQNENRHRNKLKYQ